MGGGKPLAIRRGVFRERLGVVGDLGGRDLGGEEEIQRDFLWAFKKVTRA